MIIKMYIEIMSSNEIGVGRSRFDPGTTLLKTLKTRNPSSHKISKYN